MTVPAQPHQILNIIISAIMVNVVYYQNPFIVYTALHTHNVHTLLYHYLAINVLAMFPVAMQTATVKLVSPNSLTGLRTKNVSAFGMPYFSGLFPNNFLTVTTRKIFSGFLGIILTCPGTIFPPTNFQMAGFCIKP